MTAASAVPASRAGGYGRAAMTTALLAGMFVLIVGALALWFVHRQFGGYDLSPMVDLRYRLAQGEVPGRDFISTLPLTFALLLKLSLIFGDGWFSLTWINLALFAATAVLFTTYWPVRLGRLRLALALVALSLPVLFAGYIWHSELSQLIGAAYVVLTLAYFDRKSPSVALSALLAVTAGALFFSKQNLGPPLVAAVLAASFGATTLQPEHKPRARVAFGLNLAGVGSTGLLLMGALHMAPAGLVHTFTDVLGRSSPSTEQIAAMPIKPYQVAVGCILVFGYQLLRRRIGITIPSWAALAWLPVCVLLMAANRSAPMEALAITAFVGLIILWLSSVPDVDPERRVFGCIVIAALLTSLLPILTDWDTTFDHCTIPFLTLLILMDLADERRRLLAEATVVIALTGAALGGFSRERLLGVGDFWEKPPLETISQGYFEGLQVGRHMAAIKSELVTALKDRRGASVFCGPRIEFCYADNHLRSPAGLPLWWHPGTSYPREIEPRIVKQFAADRFDYLVFRRGDRTRMPKEILKYIEETYEMQPGFQALDVYVRSNRTADERAIDLSGRKMFPNEASP